MTNNRTCIIVVPAYNIVPNVLEQLSLKQLGSIVKKDIDICIVCPSYVNALEYEQILGGCNVMTRVFDDKFFKSNIAYSQLCLSYDFYNRFEEYEYMLIYQTDCWIFRNDILDWCRMGYDYIGAPIYSPGSRWPGFKTSGRPIVGNGGLSLRKISTMMKITNADNYIYNKHKDEWSSIEYEDMFICDVVAHEIRMNIPSWEIAEKFSIDCPPPSSRRINPMGVHRVFAMYNLWNKIIPVLNEPDINKLCEESYEGFKKMYE